MANAMQKFQQELVDIPTGFLTQIWSEPRDLPQEWGLSRLRSEVRRGYDTVISAPLSSALTILTGAGAISLLLVILLLAGAADSLISAGSSTLTISAYLKDGLSEESVTTLIKELESEPRIESAQFLSKDGALAAFRRDLGPKAGFLDGLKEDNPLPASIEITLRAASRSDAVVVLDQLRKRGEVADLSYGGEFLERARGVVQRVRTGGGILCLIVLLAALLLSGAVMRLSVYARRTEIEIMELVGASDSFILAPYAVSGAIQGLLASILGVFFAWATIALLPSFGSLSDGAQGFFLGIPFEGVQFLGGGAVVIILVVGAALFSLSAVLSARSELR